MNLMNMLMMGGGGYNYPTNPAMRGVRSEGNMPTIGSWPGAGGMPGRKPMVNPESTRGVSNQGGTPYTYGPGGYSDAGPFNMYWMHPSSFLPTQPSPQKPKQNGPNPYAQETDQGMDVNPNQNWNNPTYDPRYRNRGNSWGY